MVRLPSGLRVRVAETGPADGAPVVLVHGWCCSLYTFRHNVAALAESGHRVVAFDLKGHGLSDKPREPAAYTRDAMVAHLAEVLDALAVGPASLVGHSMGAAIALTLALREPARVRRLALLAPVGFGTINFLHAARVLSPAPLTRCLPYLVSRRAVRAVLSLAYGRRGRFTPRDVEEYWAPSQFPEYACAMRHLLHAFTWDPGREEDLRRVEAPTLVMLGAADRLVVAATTERLARSIPRSSLRVLDDVGHVVPEEAPAEVNAALGAHLAGAAGV